MRVKESAVTQKKYKGGLGTLHESPVLNILSMRSKFRKELPGRILEELLERTRTTFSNLSQMIFSFNSIN
jgi:hypothetical protein